MAQDTHYKNTYSDTIDVLIQQDKPDLASACLVDMIDGENNFYQYLGVISSGTLNPSRGDATVIYEGDYRRRNIILNNVTHTTNFSKRDMIQMTADPTDPTIVAFHEFFNSRIDEDAITALGGTALTGKAGTTSTALPASQVIASSGGTYSGTTAGMNLTKFKGAVTMLRQAKLGKDLWCVMSPGDHSDFLDIDQVINGDYGYQSLIKGQADMFMGVKIIVSAECPDGVSYMWTKQALRLVYGKGVTGTELIVDRDMGKNYDYQVFGSIWFGWSRMTEEGVVKILTA